MSDPKKTLNPVRRRFSEASFVFAVALCVKLVVVFWLNDQNNPQDAGALFAGIYDQPYLDFGIDFASLGAEVPPTPQIQAVAALPFVRAIAPELAPRSLST